PIGARVAAAPQHPIRFATNDLTSTENRACVAGDIAQKTMTALCEALPEWAGEARFQIHLPRRFSPVQTEPQPVERRLWIEAIIHHPHDDLHMSLRLHKAAHHAKGRIQ